MMAKKMINIKDNREIEQQHHDNPLIQRFANKTLKHLSEQENLIIFPPTIKESTDLEDDQFIFENRNGCLRTSNVVGILKEGTNEIKITSRFYKEGSDDYFIRYMLEKVTNINVTTHHMTSNDSNSYHDLLAFLFPYYLNNAMKKGIFKTYVKKQYSDANIRGPIDFSRHISSNVPFTGKIAYNTREYSYDNEVTQLIRHTIHKLEEKYSFGSINDNAHQKNIRDIIFETPTYSRTNRLDIMEENISKPVRHGYYHEYYLLQQLCLKILRDEKIDFGKDDNEINGLLIDVAWLWEKYVATLLTENYVHADNKTKENGFSIYSDRKRPRAFPDFYSRDTILDAKYKFSENISREDLYQITAYLHVRCASYAGVIYPAVKNLGFKRLGKLAGYGGEVFTVGILIPQHCKSYEEFVEKVNHSENEFKSNYIL